MRKRTFTKHSWSADHRDPSFRTARHRIPAIPARPREPVNGEPGISTRPRNRKERKTHFDKLVPIHPTAQDPSLDTGSPGELGHKRQQARQPRRLLAHILEPCSALLRTTRRRGIASESGLESLQQQSKEYVERESPDERRVRRVERVRRFMQKRSQSRRDRIPARRCGRQRWREVVRTRRGGWRCWRRRDVRASGDERLQFEVERRRVQRRGEAVVEAEVSTESSRAE